MTTTRTDYDAVVVGASLAGCSAAILLGRAGARVALVERRPDPAAFKRICSHFIQPSAVPTLERLGLLEEIERAGATRGGTRLVTRWGKIDPGPASLVPRAVNLRRERLDPLLRRAAAETPGVELMLGQAADQLRRTGGRVSGVTVRDRAGRRRDLGARLVVGADGRDSRVAKLGEVPAKVHPHARFAFAAYFEGPGPEGAPDTTAWLTDPHFAAAFPTDSGLTLYGAMPTKDRLPEFRRDREVALTDFFAGLPQAPAIRESRRVSPVLGKVEMPNVTRRVATPGLALVGDAALATDPLWGVGCGWALQSAEWLADSVLPGLLGAEDLERGLRRYRRRHRRRLGLHALLIHDYSTGRPFSLLERALFSSAVEDLRVAQTMEAMGTRSVGPERLLSPATIGRVAVAQAHRATRASRRRAPARARAGRPAPRRPAPRRR